MPGPAGQHTLILQQDRATKKVTGKMTQPRVQQIPALTGIRIIAATWVVIEHFRNVIYGLIPEMRGAHLFIEAGYLGVEVFFVLSGFIISHNYADRFQHFSFPGYRRFLQNRLARLYPVHLVTLGSVLLLVIAADILRINLVSQEKYDPLSFVMNFLMLQAIPPAEAWNGPAWSISAEAGAYVVFPLLALAGMKVRSRIGLLTLAGLAVALTITGQFWIESTSGFDPTGYSAIWFRIFGEFAAGCFIWQFWRNAAKPRKIFDLLAVLSIGGIGAVIGWSGNIGAANFLVLPFILLFTLSCASAVGPVKRFLSSRAMNYGGRISYSLYMVHFLILMIGGKVLPWEKFADAPLVARVTVLLAYFAASFVAAGLLYRFVEEPGRRAISKLGAPVRKNGGLSRSNAPV